MWSDIPRIRIWNRIEKSSQSRIRMHPYDIHIKIEYEYEYPYLHFKRIRIRIIRMFSHPDPSLCMSRWHRAARVLTHTGVRTCVRPRHGPNLWARRIVQWPKYPHPTMPATMRSKRRDRRHLHPRGFHDDPSLKSAVLINLSMLFFFLSFSFSFSSAFFLSYICS